MAFLAYWRVILIAAALGYGAYWHYTAVSLERDYATAVAKAEKEQRDEERARVERQARAVDKVQAAAAQSDLAAGRARAAEQRLRRELERTLAARSESSGDSALDVCWSTGAKIGAVLNQCVARYRELGERADAARKAGLICEASYDALPSSSERPESVK